MYDIYISYFDVDDNGRKVLIPGQMNLQSYPYPGFLTDLDLDKIAIYDAKVTGEMGKSGSFEFSMYPNNQYYNSLRPLFTMLRVTDGPDTIFYGRVLTVDDDRMTAARKVHCEGYLSILLDTQIEGKKDEDRDKISGATYIDRLITNHNNTCTDPSLEFNPPKSFTKGLLPGVSGYSSLPKEQQIETLPNDFRYGTNGWQDTSSAFSSLIGSYGGYLRARYDGGQVYLDYLDTYFSKTDYQNKVIEVSENVLSMNSTNSVDNLFTYLIPVGSKDGEKLYVTGKKYTPPTGGGQEGGGSGGTTTSSSLDSDVGSGSGGGGSSSGAELTWEHKYIRVCDIKTVGGYSTADLNKKMYRTELEYLQSLQKHGVIYKTVTFNDADTVDKLWTEAWKYVYENYCGEVTSITATAVDLGLTDSNLLYGRIHVGDMVTIKYRNYIPDVGYVDVSLPRTVMSIQYDLANPENNQYTIGVPSGTLNNQNSAKEKKASKGKASKAAAINDPGAPDGLYDQLRARENDLKERLYAHYITTIYNRDYYKDYKDKYGDNAAWSIERTSELILTNGVARHDPDAQRQLFTLLLDGHNGTMTGFRQPETGPVKDLTNDTQAQDWYRALTTATLDAWKGCLTFKEKTDTLLEDFARHKREPNNLIYLGWQKSGNTTKNAGVLNLGVSFLPNVSNPIPGFTPPELPDISAESLIDTIKDTIQLSASGTDPTGATDPDNTSNTEDGVEGRIRVGNSGNNADKPQKWKITINAKKTYKNIKGETITSTGFIDAIDVSAKSIKSFRTKFAAIENLIVGNLQATNARIDNLEADMITAKDISAMRAYIGKIRSGSIYADTKVSAMNIYAGDVLLRSGADPTKSLWNAGIGLRKIENQDGTITIELANFRALNGTYDSSVTFSSAAALEFGSWDSSVLTITSGSNTYQLNIVPKNTDMEGNAYVVTPLPGDPRYGDADIIVSSAGSVAQSDDIFVSAETGLHVPRHIMLNCTAIYNSVTLSSLTWNEGVGTITLSSGVNSKTIGVYAKPLNADDLEYVVTAAPDPYNGSRKIRGRTNIIVNATDWTDNATPVSVNSGGFMVSLNCSDNYNAGGATAGIKKIEAYTGDVSEHEAYVQGLFTYDRVYQVTPKYTNAGGDEVETENYAYFRTPASPTISGLSWNEGVGTITLSSGVNSRTFGVNAKPYNASDDPYVVTAVPDVYNGSRLIRGRTNVIITATDWTPNATPTAINSGGFMVSLDCSANYNAGGETAGIARVTTYNESLDGLSIQQLNTPDRVYQIVPKYVSAAGVDTDTSNVVYIRTPPATDSSGNVNVESITWASGGIGTITLSNANTFKHLYVSVKNTNASGGYYSVSTIEDSNHIRRYGSATIVANMTSAVGDGSTSGAVLLDCSSVYNAGGATAGVSTISAYNDSTSGLNIQQLNTFNKVYRVEPKYTNASNAPTVTSNYFYFRTPADPSGNVTVNSVTWSGATGTINLSNGKSDSKITIGIKGTNSSNSAYSVTAVNNSNSVKSNGTASIIAQCTSSLGQNSNVTSGTVTLDCSAVYNAAGATAGVNAVDQYTGSTTGLSIKNLTVRDAVYKITPKYTGTDGTATTTSNVYYIRTPASNDQSGNVTVNSVTWSGATGTINLSNGKSDSKITIGIKGTNSSNGAYSVTAANNSSNIKSNGTASIIAQCTSSLGQNGNITSGTVTLDCSAVYNAAGVTASVSSVDSYTGSTSGLTIKDLTLDTVYKITPKYTGTNGSAVTTGHLYYVRVPAASSVTVSSVSWSKGVGTIKLSGSTNTGTIEFDLNNTVAKKVVGLDAYVNGIPTMASTTVPIRCISTLGNSSNISANQTIFLNIEDAAKEIYGDGKNSVTFAAETASTTVPTNTGLWAAKLTSAQISDDTSYAIGVHAKLSNGKTKSITLTSSNDSNSKHKYVTIKQDGNVVGKRITDNTWDNGGKTAAVKIESSSSNSSAQNLAANTYYKITPTYKDHEGTVQNSSHVSYIKTPASSSGSSASYTLSGVSTGNDYGDSMPAGFFSGYTYQQVFLPKAKDHYYRYIKFKVDKKNFAFFFSG